jgi:hypothetical protein
MDDLTIQQLIKAKFSGQLDQSATYINLTIQAIAVMVGGLVLWRISNALHKKKQQERQRNPYFESTYSKHWRKR